MSATSNTTSYRDKNENCAHVKSVQYDCPTRDVINAVQQTERMDVANVVGRNGPFLQQNWLHR